MPIFKISSQNGITPRPHLCILECVITSHYKLIDNMNVFITWKSMCSLSVCIWNTQMTSSTLLSHLFSEYRWWTPRAELTNHNVKERSQTETLPLADGKPSHSCILPTSAVLLSNYGSLNSLVAAFMLPFTTMTKSTGYHNYILVGVLQSDLSCNIFLQWGQVAIGPMPEYWCHIDLGTP